MSASFETIRPQVNNCVGEIVLNRPEKRNALNAKMVDELHTIFAAWEKDAHVKIVLLKGEGKAFCSGADLAYLQEMQHFDYQKNLQDSRDLGRLFLRIYTFPKPVIAQVEGPALAGGCGLASVCDLIIASENAKFGYPEVKIGFVAALVSTFLIRQIGERKAKELLLSGRILSAREALDFGLINQVVTPDRMQDSIRQWIEILMKNGKQAMAVTKRLFSDFSYQNIEKDIERLSEVNAHFRQTDEFSEGIRAFLEKRLPNWQSETKREERIC